MPKTLILKDVPDELYERLKLSAQMRRRSMSSEAIVCLAAALLPGKLTPTERLARARALRAELQNGEFRGRDIDAAKREGRA
jgi:plasmid stability protein